MGERQAHNYTEEKTMIDYVSILKANPNGVLATHDGEMLRTRVFQYLFADGNKVYFCTNSEKQVYAQLKAKPNVSFCTYPADFSQVLSINGKAAFVEDMALKTRVMDENPMIKGLYASAENPIFKLFYVDVAEVTVFSLSEGLQRYKI
jgi:uncharacterized pyridoxamine 5'-phosphate oxidase family protein